MMGSTEGKGREVRLEIKMKTCSHSEKSEMGHGKSTKTKIRRSCSRPYFAPCLL